MTTWAKIWRNDKTIFILLIAFFIVALLSSGSAAAIVLYTQLNILSTIGAVFMLGFLTALYWRTSAKVMPQIHWPIILGISAVIWLIGNLTYVATFRGVSITSWQLVVVGSLIFGYYNPEVNRWWRGLYGQARWAIVVFLAAATVVGWCTYAILLQQSQFDTLTVFLFSQTRLGIGLLLIFGAWLPLIYHVCRHIELKLQHRNWL